MRLYTSISVYTFLCTSIAACFPAEHHNQAQISLSRSHNHNVSIQLFAQLEELARLVDIAYCVGVTGIYPPFECASRCSEFPGYQLVETWNTGPLMADSCGYIVTDHSGAGRIIVAFRGTYSVANTIMDLSTIPQEYVPYPSDPSEDDLSHRRYSYLDLLPRPWRWFKKEPSTRRSKPVTDTDDKEKGPKCTNCTVHTGFFTSWTTTRPLVLPHLRRLHDLYPTYTLHLVGHSLGGAVAALAALECEAKGWHPTVTTFGEPRIGNTGLREYVDAVFDLPRSNSSTTQKTADKEEDESHLHSRYRRLTHVSDPVPLLPLTEWGFVMHAGEIYISKRDLQPGVSDLRLCDGDEDPRCIYGEEAGADATKIHLPRELRDLVGVDGAEKGLGGGDEDEVGAKWGLPTRYKMWQLFFAHRDYFWRLGLCVPGGDPAGWGRRYEFGGLRGQEEQTEVQTEGQGRTQRETEDQMEL